MKNLNEKIVKRLSRHKEFFSSNAELGNEEYVTSEYIKNCLLKAGYIVENINNSTGLLAELKENSDEKKCLFFRAEMDALPVGNGIVRHACGHDSHMAIMLSFAEELSYYPDVNINVAFLFQPAEELCDGAKRVLQHEIFKKYDEKYVFGVHMWADLPYCSCAFVKDSLMAGGGQFQIEIDGNAAHGAFPHLGKDSVVVAAEIVTEIQTIISRQTNPLDSAVITIGTIKGGITDNQIPPKTTITGTIRYFSEQTRIKTLEYIENICESKKIKWDIDVKFVFEERVAAMENNAKFMTEISDQVYEVFGNDGVINRYKTMAVDDFSEYLKCMPGGYVLIGCQNKDKYPQHHPDFYVDDPAMEKAFELVNKVFLKINEVKK